MKMMKVFDYQTDRDRFLRYNRRREIMAVVCGVILAVLCFGVLVFAWKSGIHLGKTRTIQPLNAKPAVQIANFRFQEEKVPEGYGIESVIKFEKNYVLGIRYPTMEDEDMKTLLKEDTDLLVSSIQKAFQQEDRVKTTVTLDFNIVPCGSQYMTVVYHIIQEFEDGAPAQEQISTCLYDLKAKKSIDIQEVFKDSYPKFMSRFVRDYFSKQEDLNALTEKEEFQAASDAVWNAYQRISYGEDSVTVYFDAGQLFDVSKGVLQVSVPYEDLIGYMNLNIADYHKPFVPDREIDKKRPMVALTFDDGPYSPVGNRILDALEKADGRATFFYVGNRINGQTAKVIQRAYEMGCEISSHTYDHPNLTKLTPDQISAQLDRTDERLKKFIGVGATTVRPPFGAVNDTVKRSVDKPMVTWSIDTLDWKTKNKDSIVKEITDKVKDGDIILMHELYPTTAEACEEVIPLLHEQGYQLVTVQELMSARGIEMKDGSVYYRASKK